MVSRPALWKLRTQSNERGPNGKWCGWQGFPAQPRTLADGGLLASANAAEEAKQQELKKGLLDLGIAWGLVAVCCAHHVGHFAHAMGYVLSLSKVPLG